MKSKKVTEDEKCKIKELYEKGYSILRIANEIGRSDGTVKKYVQEMKLVKPAKPTLVGKKFGRLTVVELDHVEKSRRYLLCKCDCGNTTVVREGNLKNGITKSCGCIRKEYLQNRKEKVATKQVKTRNNQGGVYFLQAGEIILKGNYEGEKKCSNVKEYKMSPQELADYLKELEHKEVKRRGE
ncbi:helix-turn-helix domain-containing protein [Intestinibacter sp.]|uniref:helix-turn-helix domain-containing protein n=1 Tax=Intestinibacter sp. TaxID=1965304 RepID=UPI00307E8AF0